MRVAGCALCDASGSPVVFEGNRFRVVRAEEPGYPAFYRLIWTDHVGEFSDLDAADRALCLEAVVIVEKLLREHLHPAKVNLAALGNVVPHLHWHVIARFDWDPAWPAPVWAAAQRPIDAAGLAKVERARPGLEAAIATALSSGQFTLS